MLPREESCPCCGPRASTALRRRAIARSTSRLEVREDDGAPLQLPLHLEFAFQDHEEGGGIPLGHDPLRRAEAQLPALLEAVEAARILLVQPGEEGDAAQRGEK